MCMTFLTLFNILTSNHDDFRALKTLPRFNLVMRETSSKLKAEEGIFGVWSQVLLPRGTRFGPIVGKIITPHEVTPDMDRKHFWKIFNKATGGVSFIRDAKDVTVANWMRYVQPGCGEDQNLVAYQEGQEIYFLAIRQINPNEELLVWYCNDYNKRFQSQYEQRAPQPPPPNQFAVSQYQDVSSTYFHSHVQEQVSTLNVAFPFYRMIKKKL